MSLINCPECNKEISDQAIQCPNCGFPMKSAPEANNLHPPRSDSSNTSSKKALAIVGLIVNLFWPGLGTIIGGNVGIGLIQMAFHLFGVFCILTIIGAIIGVPLVVTMWVWALISSIIQLSRS